MPTDFINLIGAGGHAAVVVDALIAGGLPKDRIRVWTQNRPTEGTSVLGIPVAWLEAPAQLASQLFHLCMGNNADRARLFGEFERLGSRANVVMHPAATVSSFASLAPGAFFAAGAIVGPRATIGKGTIVNHGAVVDHDCDVAAFVHIAPAATLAGAVKVGEGVLIGAGANVLPSLKIGAGAVVGAGSVVTRDIPPDQVYVGVPAALLAERKR
jgi:sugar O-acyltransferase (sialic acid O-acetyltransferase NeuD family)